MIGREKCAERARIFIAYPGKIVNTILIYDSNTWHFLSFSPDISRFLKWQFHFSLEGFVYAEDFGTGLSFDAVADLCRQLEVPYTRIQVPVYDIVFNQRKEKNPCSLCAKLRRGSLNTALTDLGIRKIALGHHYDDAIETLLMNLLFEGRIGCFQPVTYLDRTGITQIRPLLYCREEEIRRVARRLELPVVENPCPANGHSRRQEVKELIAGLEGRYPDIKQKLFGSLQRYPLYGWNLHEEER